jgi:Flp pilus assembly protein TadD
MGRNGSPAVAGAATAEGLAAQAHAHLRDGRLAEAEATYRAALAHCPDHFPILHNVGAVCLRRGDATGALAAFERCCTLDPRAPSARLGVGRALLALQRLDAAVAAIEQGIALDPRSPDARNLLGAALDVRGDVALAERAFRDALALDPGYVPALSNLADLLVRAERAHEANTLLERVREHLPDDPAVLFKLGFIKAYLDLPDDAAALMERVVSQVPGHAPAHLNLGTFAQWRGDVGCAIGHFRRALALAPDDPVALGNLAHALLYAGDYANGWAAYETRPQGVRHPRAAQAHPRWGARWDGRDLRGGTLLLHGEGGLGDVLQFSRYACVAAERGARVTLWLERAYEGLRALLRALPGVTAVLDGDSAPRAEAHASLSSLPYLLWTDGYPCASPMPYLRADASRVADWRARLPETRHLRAGLVWRGGRGSDPLYGPLVDRRRSVPFPLLEPLFAIHGIQWVSLQLGPNAGAWREHTFARALVDVTDGIRDFGDTAALASLLDVVVTVDTSVAHLAGALGVRTFLLNRRDSCWRWGPAGTGTFWYPSMRIFRQSRFGDWTDPLDAVSLALGALASRA